MFDAIMHAPLVKPLESQPGDVLEVIKLVGYPNQTGYQTAVRVYWGAFDYRYIESITAYQRPYSMAFEHVPERCFLMDHTERLPPIGDYWTSDPDRIFRKSFGDDPQPSHLRYDLTEADGKTTVELAFSQTVAQQTWAWLQRRKDRQIAATLEAVFNKVAQNLTSP